MQQVVTITSQGQITIPALMRRSLGLNKYHKAYAKVDNGRIIVEPVVDLLSLEGIMQHKAIRSKKINEIMTEEKQAVEKAIVKQYRFKNK